VNTLRIGWATPWNTRSAIAQSASEVAFELARRGHVITVLRTEVGEALDWEPRPAPGQIRRLVDVGPHELRDGFDVVVAHIGDHYGYHGALLERLHETVVVGVFHDAFLASIAVQWLRGDETSIRAMLRDTYDSDTWPAGEPFFQDIGDVSRRRPLIEWLARQTVGAVAHAQHYAQRLHDTCPGPVAVIPLAFSVPDLPLPPASWHQITIGVIGVGNPNKRVDQLILALGASPILRSRCRIRVIGDVSSQMREPLTWLAHTARISAPEFTGWVSDEELLWQLRDVDIMSCLRNPVLEGASASLILAQLSGRPTLVTGHGSYAEVPADTVLRCAPGHEARDVMRHLERVIDDPAARLAIGRRAQAFATARHAPAAYVDKLLPLLWDVVERRPFFLAERELARTLVDFGLPSGDPSVRRAAATLADLVQFDGGH